MSDEFVLIHEFYGEFAAREFVELLKSEGIVVSSPGLLHRGMLGMVGTYVQIPVRVPKGDAPRARELLEWIEQSDSEADFDDDKPATYRDAPDRAETVEFPRRRRIAYFMALVFPFGGGHFYARAYPTAWLLLWCCCLGVYALVNPSVPVMFTFFPVATVLFDIARSGHAVRAFNEKKPLGMLAQAVIVLVVVPTLAWMLCELGIWLEGLEESA